MQTHTNISNQRKTLNSKECSQYFRRTKKEQKPLISNVCGSSGQNQDIFPSQISKTHTTWKYKQGKSQSRHSKSKEKMSRNIYCERNRNIDNQSDSLSKLKEENNALKKVIIEMKVSQFYQFDESKLKTLLQEIEALKESLKNMKEKNQRLSLENDFLRRTNFQLKQDLSHNTNTTKILRQSHYLHRKAAEENMEEQKMTDATAYIGGSLNFYQVKSAKTFSKLPLSNLTIQQDKKNIQTQRKTDVMDSLLRYKRKRGLVSSEPQN